MNYKTVKALAEAEFIEKKSRFIAHVKPVETEQEALNFINEQKSRYWNATHNVYAYVLKENHIQRYSDDGEPTGTAGVPVLDVIRKEGLVNTVVVVTRYFGGTLLGAGGLVRAYTKSAKMGIDSAGILNMMLCGVYVIEIDYDLLGRIQSTLIEINAKIVSSDYRENVELTVLVSKEAGFEEKLINAANGRIKIRKTDEKFVEMEM